MESLIPQKEAYELEGPPLYQESATVAEIGLTSTIGDEQGATRPEIPTSLEVTNI